MRNAEIAKLFQDMGTLLEIKGDIIFKVKAYYKAADILKSMSEDIAVIASEGRLQDVAGIGKTLKEKIDEYLSTEKLVAYQKLIKEVPESLLDIVAVPSVGPKKAKLFYEKCKIKTVDGLEKAAKKGKLLECDGIKEKTVENILKGIEVFKSGQDRMHLGMATRVANEFIEALEELKEVKNISLAGSLRRGRETVGDIDILVQASKPEVIMDRFTTLPSVKSINAHGQTKSSIMTTENVQIDLRVIPKESFGAAQLYFTGSKNFNIKLRQLAQKKSMKVNEYGVFKVKGEKETLLASKTEEDCFKALGLPNIAPELREDIGESLLFGKKTDNTKLPQLIELKDIKGEVHTHSTYSDGRNTIEEMVIAAKERGYSYLALSDHSYALKVAGGVSPADLKKKRKEIDKLQKKYPKFRILCGSEVEIDSDGNLDYNDDILSELDIVIGAIHSGFEQSEAQLTKRLVKACQNKHVNIIAHPLGTHIGKREPYKVDFKAVCQAAVENNVFLEINAFPIRLDLNSSNVFFAKQLGVKFVINTDAHHVNHFNHLRHGVSVARRGWLTKKDVLNTHSVESLLKMIKK